MSNTPKPISISPVDIVFKVMIPMFIPKNTLDILTQTTTNEAINQEVMKHAKDLLIEIPQDAIIKAIVNVHKVEL